LILNDVRKTVEYDGRTWKVDRAIRGTGESLTLALEAVPELPEEPPEGTILVDDVGRPWWRQGRHWFSSHPKGGYGITWRELLAKSDLRNVMVAGKATDYLVRFKGVPREGAIRKSINASTYDRAPFWASGYTEMEAPVHGYFERVPE
jgi:hypothetical protein